MNIKLDENLSRYLKPIAQRLGHDVATIAEEGLLGMSDIAVGKTAQIEGRILLTLDIEFADLRKHPPGTHPGISAVSPADDGAYGR